MNCNDRSDLSSRYSLGELDEARAADFADHLKRCPACASDQELDAQLHRAVIAESVNAGRVDGEIRTRIARAAHLRRLWVKAGIAAAVVIGLLIYRYRPAPDSIYAAAAQDHQREVVDHQRRTWISSAPEISALAARQGLSTSDVDAISEPGYHVDRAKLCRLNGRIFLHLVYSGGPREFSVFLRPPDHPRIAPVQIEGIGNECVATFETVHVTGLVVTAGSTDAAVIAQTAARVL
jgi:anti-sigma factor RsiW